MKSELLDILRLLDVESYQTAVELADMIGVSEKTVRTRMKELNGTLAAHGAGVISKQKLGYLLRIDDTAVYAVFLSAIGTKEQQLPSNAEERESYILTYLLNNSGYVKIESIADFLYISRKTITADIKKVEYTLGLYGISLTRRPNYGIRAEGSEFDKRTCLANILLKSNPLYRNNHKIQEGQKKIAAVLQTVLNHHMIRISEIAFQVLTIHLYVAIRCIRQGRSIDVTAEREKCELNELIMNASGAIASEIETQFSVSLPEGEVFYIAIILSGTMSSDTALKLPKNLEITSQIDRLSMSMISSVYDGFKLDFRDNFDLRMSLNKHMVPFNIRMLYGIPLQNPILEHVKKECPYAYNLAAHASIVLNEFYNTHVSEDEIGYFALLFQFALEKQDYAVDKKNILVVCASGIGSSQLFIHRYRQAFGKYVEQIRECTVLELEAYNFSEIDYIFTTIPLNVSVPVPVFEVSLFWDQKEATAVQHLFESDRSGIIKRYFSPEYFYSDIQFQDKEEVIAFLCEAAGQHFQLPDNFYESVMRRENLGQTDFGNLSAIPHPFSVMTEDSFVIAGVLDKPIWWGHNEVQIVFLVSISKAGDKDIEEFYQMITDLLFDAEKMRRLIREPSYSNLVTLLNSSADMRFN